MEWADYLEPAGIGTGSEPRSHVEMVMPVRFWARDLNWIGPAWSWTSIGPAWSWIFNWIISSISNSSWPIWTSWSRIYWTALEKPSLMALAPLRVVGPRLTKGTSIWMAASPVPKPISCQALQFSPLRLFHFVFSHLWFLELPETTHDHQE